MIHLLRSLRKPTTKGVRRTRTRIPLKKLLTTPLSQDDGCQPEEQEKAR